MIRKTAFVSLIAFLALLMTFTVASADTGQYRIGCVVPLSGPFAILGESLKNGLQIALEMNGGQILDREDTRG